MTARREVRATDEFFDDLDRQLGDERGQEGEPSATDFLLMDLPAIIEQFAERFDDLLEVVPGEPTVRVVVGAGILVRAVVVYGVELSDGVVELVGVEIDV